MRRHAKASTAGSTQRRAKDLGRFFRGVVACRGFSPNANGSSAPASHLRALALAAAITALLIAPAVANAAPPVAFAKFGTGAGQVDFPTSVAVDRSSGNVYVADGNNFRIDKFDADGTFLMAWGYGVADRTTLALQTCGPEATPPTTKCFVGEGANVASGPGAVHPRELAVDQSTGDVYVFDAGYSRVGKFSSTGEFLLMFGKGVNQGGGTPSNPGDVCTAADVANGDVCGGGQGGGEPGEFSIFEAPIAVDSTGKVWVGDFERLEQFNPDGTFISQILLPGAGKAKSLALDSADNFYMKSEGFTGIRKLEAGTGALLETLDATGQPVTVTVDGSDNVYIGDRTVPYRFLVFDAAGQQTGQFGAGQVSTDSFGNGLAGNAIAIGDSAGPLYAVNTLSKEESAAHIFRLPEPGPLPHNQRAENILPTAATLAATLNPEGHATTYFFGYSTDESYGQTTPVTALSGSAFEEEEVKATIEGLLPSTTYHFRLVGTNHCNDSEPAEECAVRGEDTTFTTSPPARIGAQWVTGVTSVDAIVHAEINPLGAAATWRVEYGSDETYGSGSAEASLGSGFDDVGVQADLRGLVPGTTYHYRFVARDERDGISYAVHGPDRTFTTQVSGLDFGLGDRRAWEMVSPPDKHGALLDSSITAHVQAGANGEALVFASRGSIEAGPQGNRPPETTTGLARRTAGGWRSRDITLPNDRATAVSVGQGGEYKLFSTDLSLGLVEPRSPLPLSPEASERTPYLRENTEAPSYTPLVTDANVFPGTQFGGNPDSTLGLVLVAGASSNLRHVALNAEAPLAEGAPPAPADSLYLWGDGELQPISVLPTAEGGGIVGGEAIGSGGVTVHNAVSEDGSRVFWLPNSSKAPLYLRDTEAEETVRIDVVQGNSGAGDVEPVFQGASADGTVVFFTDSQQLTEDASPSGRDLYRCEIPTGSVATGCASLIDITAEGTDPGESAEVERLVSGMGEDGTAVYFVARGVLDATPNGLGDDAVSGAPNLYLWQAGQGVRFIATLAGGDKNSWGGNGGRTAELSAAASPSGRYLAFMSESSLTGRDNLDGVSGEPVEQVFRYDAVADRLDCVSCNPTGGAPSGEQADFLRLVDPRSQWEGEWVAAVFPQPTAKGVAAPSFYSPRAMLDSGRVFFNSVDSLVPADSNGQWDVYQHEPTGVGDCSPSSGDAATARSAGGCLSLISSGTGEAEAGFLDASESGDDVFFLTPARLNETDQDEELDVYDARVDGVPATFPLLNECLGEACQPAAVAPRDPTPASAAFKGQGNQRPQVRKRCPKGRRSVKRKGKTRCVASKHKRQKRSGRAGR